MTMKIQNLAVASLVVLLAACAPTAPKSNEPERDIYAALTNNEIQYRDDSEGEAVNTTSPAFVADQIKEVRTLYFRKQLDEAADLAERLVRVDSQQAEGYYWLARIRMDQGDFEQANEMATKGLTVVYDKNLKRELERVKGITQMGAQ